MHQHRFGVVDLFLVYLYTLYVQSGEYSWLDARSREKLCRNYNGANCNYCRVQIYDLHAYTFQ